MQKIKAFFLRYGTQIGIIFVVFGVTLFGFWIWQQFSQSIEQGQLSDYINRAETAIDEEDYVTAYNLYQEARTIEPDNLIFLERQADIAFMNGDYKIARQLYLQTEQDNIAEVDYYEFLTALAAQNYTEAEIKLVSIGDNLHETRPLNEDRFTRLQEQLTLIQNETNQPVQKAMTAKLLIEEYAYELADDVLLELINENPGYRDAHYLLGVNYARQNKTTQAKEALNSALAIDPNYEPVRELLAQLDNQ